MEINYVGEHLLPGYIGHFLTILSLFTALFAGISYFLAARDENNDQFKNWDKAGNLLFIIHGLSIFGIVGILYYLISGHFWEYQYVWQHSSLDLPPRYRLSCFWEGQEGSFLLWGFWQVILGFVLIRKAGQWRPSVMMTVSFVQFFLSAMLIGVYFFGYKIGSSPFVLMREVNLIAPIFQTPDYLSFIKDGNGLNPLLQNYWMVIHPPTLFFGFAACLIPFAYSIAGLWRNNFSKLWQNTVIQWSLIAGGVLGIGVLMGGAWAYESLTFGGFWAWDPVENASLMPWITLIAGLHCVVAFKHSGHALKTGLVLLLSTFLLVLYSTFLTRSGVLGDTSVHSFTDLGMSGQLLAFLGFFIVLSIIVFFKNIRNIPMKIEEERTDAREFWMFVGAIVLFVYGLFIIWNTSWPAINRITEANWFQNIPLLNQFANNKTVITDPISFYNGISMWFAIIMLSIMAFAQYFRYKKSSKKHWVKNVIGSLAVALVVTIILNFVLDIPFLSEYKLKIAGKSKFTFVSPYFIFLFTGFYALVGNLDYFRRVLSGKILISGGSVAHIGFALIMIGSLVSNFNKHVISWNTLGLDYPEFDEKAKRENIFLPVDKPVQMGPYWVTYKGDSVALPNTYFKVLYERKENLDDVADESFVLTPNAQINPKMGLISNPSSKHYLLKDVFTYVSSTPQRNQNDTTETYKIKRMAIGDTIIAAKSFVILEEIIPNPSHPSLLATESVVSAAARFRIEHLADIYYAEPIYYIDGSVEKNIPAAVDEILLDLEFLKILPSSNEFEIGVKEIDVPQDFIIMKATIFPYINILWLGSIILGIGFILSYFQKSRESKRIINKNII